jgi:hypothetical protein
MVRRRERRFVPIATDALQQTASLFDHLVGDGEQPGRQRDPITGIVGCCARAANGHAAAAPLRSVMNSRRCMSAPKLRRQHCIGPDWYFDRG